MLRLTNAKFVAKKHTLRRNCAQPKNPGIRVPSYVAETEFFDFERFCMYTEIANFFLICANSNSQFRLFAPVASQTRRAQIRPEHSTKGVYALKDCLQKLQLDKHYDEETDETLAFLANSLSLRTLAITQPYRCRRQLGVFYKWIKHYV